MNDKARDLVTSNRCRHDGAARAAMRSVPDESLARYSLAGWIILALFFGGFGYGP